MGMILDEAIKNAEKVADEKKKEACNLYDVKNYEESRECIWCSEEHRQLAEWLKELKQLREQTKWIPVSERLPEKFQRVLVTIVNYKGNKVVRVAECYNRKEKCVFQIKENHEEWEVGEKRLLAWMPLPEPYKAESEG